MARVARNLLMSACTAIPNSPPLPAFGRLFSIVASREADISRKADYQDANNRPTAALADLQQRTSPLAKSSPREFSHGPHAEAPQKGKLTCRYPDGEPSKSELFAFDKSEVDLSRRITPKQMQAIRKSALSISARTFASPRASIRN